jgi:hypothetical protein
LVHKEDEVDEEGKKQKKSGYVLQFLDLMHFTAGGTLEENSRAFSGHDQRVKGVFPYELLTVDNYITELAKTELFHREDFYSSLSGANISDADWNMYCEDAKNYKNRLEYLLHYNEEDTKIMIPIIEKLIALCKQYGVDMLRQVFLSANASQLKYIMAYQGFDMDADYSKVVETTYTLTPKVGERSVSHILSRTRNDIRIFLQRRNLKHSKNILARMFVLVISLGQRNYLKLTSVLTVKKDLQRKISLL